MNICYCGQNHVGFMGLLYLISTKHNIVGVVSYSDSVKELAEEFNIKVYKSIYDKKFIDFSTNSSFVTICIHGREIFKELPFCGVNLHPYLYAYKGASPIQRAIEEKNARASVGAHIITEHLDSGKMIVEKFLDIKLGSVQEIYNQLYPIYIKTLRTVLSIIEDERINKLGGENVMD